MRVELLQEKLGEHSQELYLLHRICSYLTSSQNLQETLEEIFKTFESELHLMKAIVSLKEFESDESYIESSFGFTPKELASPAFSKWAAINQEVLNTSESKFISDIPFKDFDFGENINNDDISLLCLPMIIKDAQIGTLSIFVHCTDEASLIETYKIFDILTLLIGQKVKLRSLMKLEQDALRDENIKLKHELSKKYNIHNMIGNSGAMKEVYENIIQVANSNATVLIRGESGTGKELVANAIHYNSNRAEAPFIKINCGAIPESLIESELFGYEKGSFTDASQQKIGKFEAADSGTIFLDEIAELSPALQVRLLRVLQEKEIIRVGGITPIKINVRVITATNRDLEQAMHANQFRQDLYYRLNVFPVFLPPLRERKTDILLLAEHFLKKYSEENGKSISRISTVAIDLLNSYHWPGNVRELENCIERSVIVCNTDTIQAPDLPSSLQRADMAVHSPKEMTSLEDVVSQFEKELICETLKKFNGNVSRSSKHLKTTQRILGYKIKHLGINPKMYKV